MKRSYIRTLILFISVIMMSLSLNIVLANEIVDDVFIVPKVANESITIDAEHTEAAWAEVMTSELGSVDTEDDYYVLFGSLYDDNNLYFYFQVTDDVLHYAETATWNTDAIEVYIDGDNSKENTWDGVNDYQITTPLMAQTIDDWVGTNEYPRDYIVFSIKETDLGWDLEYSIDLLELEIVDEFGFDCALNDADDTGARETQVWFLEDGDRWNNPSAWKVAALGDMLPVSGVGDMVGRIVPTQFNLDQNYPNPFNPTTNIPFEIDARGHVQLTVYNVLGETVATLVDAITEPGSYTVPFNAGNLNSGIYYYQLKKGTQLLTGKMLFIK